MTAEAAATDPLALLGPRTRANVADLASRFHAADPFPHVVIDEFLHPDACRRLLEEFPPFERGNSFDENGRPGSKSVFEALRVLGPGFAALDTLISAPAFLALLTEITGVERLIYDPDYLGGGTHENRAPQRLDFHVDFNRHPRGWERRLNLLYYLNPEWDEAWGGCLELRRDPRVPATPIAPRMNRAVLFSTSERSWHGFPTIQPGTPTTRRSIALYFYTPARRVPAHSTIYVEEPADPEALERVPDLLLRRMDNLARLQRQEQVLLEEARLALGQAVATEAREPTAMLWPIGFVDEELARLRGRELDLRAALERIVALPRVPLSGPIRPIAQTGYWHDGWANQRLVVRGAAIGNASELWIGGVIPPEVGPQELTLGATTATFPPGRFEWRVPFEAVPGDAVTIEITAARVFCPRRLGLSDDSRELAWVLESMEARSA